MNCPVSVVIPAYNAERFIADALASVQAQSCQPLEIIVVDDGSTDRTAQLVRGFAGVCYLRQDNAGPSRARNAGIRAARGEYIAFLDADDLWLEEKLERQMALAAREPGLGLIVTNVRFLQNGVLSEPMFQLEGLGEAWFGDPRLVTDQTRKLLGRNFVNTSAVFARRDLLLRHLFNEQRKHNEDWELWLKMSLDCPFGHVDEVCVHERQFGESLSSDRCQMLLSQVEVFEAFLDRVPPLQAPSLRREFLKDLYKWVGYHFMNSHQAGQARHFYRKSLAEGFDVKTVLYYLKSSLQG